MQASTRFIHLAVLAASVVSADVTMSGNGPVISGMIIDGRLPGGMAPMSGANAPVPSLPSMPSMPPMPAPGGESRPSYGPGNNVISNAKPGDVINFQAERLRE